MKHCVICGKIVGKGDPIVKKLSKTFAENLDFCGIECYNDWEAEGLPPELEEEESVDD